MKPSDFDPADAVPIEEPFHLRSRNDEPIRGEIAWTEQEEGHPPPADRPVVFVCHGFKGFRSWGFFPAIARELARSGFVSIRFDFSRNGIGENPEEFTRLDRFETNSVTLELDDLGRVMRAVADGSITSRERFVGPWGILGHSRGGAVAILGASRESRVRALTTWSAVSTFHRYSERQLAEWQREGFLSFPNQRTGQIMRVGRELLADLTSRRDEIDVLRAASSLRIPYLVVHGEEDLSVPPSDAEAIYAAAPPDGDFRLLRVERTGHTFGATHPYGGETPALRGILASTIDFLRASLQTHSEKKA